MKDFRRVCVAALGIVVASCATTYLQTDDLQKQLNRQLTTVDANGEKAEQNYAEQTDIFKGLTGLASDAARDQMKDCYSRMTSGIENLRRLKKGLHDERESFVSLAGQRTEIKNNDKDFISAQDIVHQFNQDIQFFNQEFSSYGRAYNDLKEIINQNKLNQWADADEVRLQLKKSLARASKNFAVLETNITSTQVLAEQNGQPLPEATQHRLAALRDSFKDHVNRLELTEKYFRLELGQVHRISSADPQWPAFFQHAKEAEDVSREMQDISKRVKAELETAQKRSRPNG